MPTLYINENQIHVWRANLELEAEQLDGMINTLSSREYSRGKRLLNPVHQQRYLAGHAILRNILSRYVDVKPVDIQFQYSSHGKPSLMDEQNPLYLRFNMTHSRHLAVYAINSNRELGVDIEYVRPNRQAMALAKRYFTESEYLQLVGLPEDEQLEGFYRAWTRKEAFIKGIGLGLSFPLKNFAVDIGSMDNSPVILVDTNSDQSFFNWRIAPLDEIDSQFCAALAYQGEKDEVAQINCWNWEYFSS